MPATSTSRRHFALAFETSSAWGSVALGHAADVLETRAFSAPRRHAIEFLPAIDTLCRDHGVAPEAVRCVYVSVGPGSFTGLRLGVTVARTIALSTGARVIGIPSLQVIAQNAADAAPPPTEVAVILDAKRGRVYAARFARREDTYVAVSEAAELDPAEFLAEQGRSCAVLGEGVTYHREAVKASGLSVLPEARYRPRADTVYRLGTGLARRGRFDDPRQLIPVYVRPPEAEEKWKQRQRKQS